MWMSEVEELKDIEKCSRCPPGHKELNAANNLNKFRSRPKTPEKHPIQENISIAAL